MAVVACRERLRRVSRVMKRFFRNIPLCLFLLIVGPMLVVFAAALLAERLEAQWRRDRKRAN